MQNDNLGHANPSIPLKNIWQYSIGIIKDIFKLFSLEVKLAGKSLAILLILIALIALLLISAWLSLLGAVIVWLMHFHINLSLSLLLMSAFNFILALAIVYSIIKISTNLQFKETRKQLEMIRGKHETITLSN
jgi:uncharacterized membrane protein YqjE